MCPPSAIKSRIHCTMHDILRLESFNINYNADITGVSRLILEEKIFVFVNWYFIIIRRELWLGFNFFYLAPCFHSMKSSKIC